MDGYSMNRSDSFESLVIQSVATTTELKGKLNDIIRAGPDYNLDVSSCLKILLNTADLEIIELAVRAIAELSKCEEKREQYAQNEIVEAILKLIPKNIEPEKYELVKHSCRALGNLCCDCDKGRQYIIKNKGTKTLMTLLDKCSMHGNGEIEEIKLFACKTLLNFVIGGPEMIEIAKDSGLVATTHKILLKELEKDVMRDDIVSTALLLLSVINDNFSEHLFDEEINCTVLNVLKETTNVEVTEICLDHLHIQAEHDSVKTLIAHKGGVNLVCNRLEMLLTMDKEASAEDPEVEAAMKQACDLMVIVLTGDDAMDFLYDNSKGEVYSTMVRWLDSPNHCLQSTAILGIGNFARKDEYCVHMMESGVFDKLLDLLEKYLSMLPSRVKGEISNIQEETQTTKLIHAVASAIRNLVVPDVNKKVAAEKARAAPLLIKAAEEATQHNQAYSVMAAIRMMVKGSEAVSRQVSESGAVQAAQRWGVAAAAAAAGEASRLLAALLHAHPAPHMLKVVGCVACLVNMLVASHSIMQNEAILSLTLLAIEAFRKNESDFDYEEAFIKQAVDSEIGMHIMILIDTNCAKMPIEVAHNLLAFVELTSKKALIASDYKTAKVHESLQKFLESRKDITDDMKGRLNVLIKTINDAADVTSEE